MIFRKSVLAAAGLLLSAFSAFAAPPPGIPKEPGPGWSKKGVHFWMHCFDDEKPGPDCGPRKIASPDGKSTVEIFYKRPKKPLDVTDFPSDRYAYLRIVMPDQSSRVILADGARLDGPDGELIWAPNSKTFLINTHASAAYDYIVRVYSLDDPQLRAQDPTRAAALDLAYSLRPWCQRRVPPNQEDCRPVLSAADFNMVAVDWLSDSSGIAVSAEVPGSSSQGIIMGQARGYEIGVLGHQFLGP